MTNPIYIGEHIKHVLDTEPVGGFIRINGEAFYKLSNVDQMRPFFMTIVSADDHWLFVSSNKGITAGRQGSDTALFPYYTDDKLGTSSETTGGKTIMLVSDGDKTSLWEPFSERYTGLYSIERNLYKNQVGSKVIFEEVNNDLGLIFSEQWSFSNEYGIIKSSFIRNDSNSTLSIKMLDGIQNIIPTNVSEQMQSLKSNLVDAYKKAELYNGQIGIYSLSAQIVDRAIPSESLESTIAWSTGLAVKNVLLTSQQLDNFRDGKAVVNEVDKRAEKGAFFINSDLSLEPGDSRNWHIIADVVKSSTDIAKLNNEISSQTDLFAKILVDIEKNSTGLLEKIARADGIQYSKDKFNTTRHLSNVMFNIMRGGIFVNEYTIERDYFIEYVSSVNAETYKQNLDFLNDLPKTLTTHELKGLAKTTEDHDLIRIAYEYIPLTFSRRHGDPSRPWNKFYINTRDENGEDNLYYEGNWRDIFQNWEALGVSYPGFIENMILKFVNASTLDGYNPYRISSNGIDWEVVEPDNPWSYIGYWGDHQLIYLLKLLELQYKIDPERLESLLSQSIAVYANVPYRIKPFSEIIVNPQDTIVFDYEQAEKIDDAVERIGSDGKLVFGHDNQLLRANLIEKLLVSVLTKISNFVPDAGIWMNTQRPEWNDANNALVGNGTSMVTLYQLRRYLEFLVELLDKFEVNYEVNSPVHDLFKTLAVIFQDEAYLSEREASSQERYKFIHEAGIAGEKYRQSAYNFFAESSLTALNTQELVEFCKKVLSVLDQTIRSNKRDDGLYHSYNIISIDNGAVIIDRLDLMLEGQVNILGSGYIKTPEAIELIASLSKSSLYRPDQDSFLLYPNKQLPEFIVRNNIDADLVKNSALVEAMLEKNYRGVIERDEDGICHFNSKLHNADELQAVLDGLKDNPEFKDLIENDRELLLEVYESVFNHKEFTGRSGTFYGYEGLGSIYWHMVSKLVLAIAEVVDRSIAEGDREITSQLVGLYQKIKAGIGVHKSPKEYGAIPTDPYSHTPGNRGVQQPGMTGQVKEDILARYAELGIHLKDGQLRFSRGFYDGEEYIETALIAKYFDIKGNWQEDQIGDSSLFFTFCQVPIIYQKSDSPSIEVHYSNGDLEKFSGNNLSKEISEMILMRTGEVQKVRCLMPD